MKNPVLKLLILCLLPALVLGQTSEKNKYAPLLDAAQKSNSSALVVLEDGEEVLTFYDDGFENKKIESMSVTKSVVALAGARLLTEGKIDSLDTPVAHYYPEWNQGLKKNITVRHLMNHTSGLQNESNTRIEIQPSPDFIQLALAASVVDTPGTKFSYNNKAVNLLPGIIRKAADQKMDGYLRNTLFKEMEITNFNWRTDDAGNLRGMAGFQVQAADLAKIGQLVLQKGFWNGKQLIDKKWMVELLAQSQPHTKASGLLWWRIPSDAKFIIDDEQIKKLKKVDIEQKMLSKLEQIKGEYNSQSAAVQALMNKFTRSEMGALKQTAQSKKVAPWRKSAGDSIMGYQATGDLGQYLIIYPKQKVVAVRMVQYSDDYNLKTDGFGNFEQMVYNLATSK